MALEGSKNYELIYYLYTEQRQEAKESSRLRQIRWVKPHKLSY